MARKPTNTTLDDALLKDIKILAIVEGCDMNDLIEEGMRLVLVKRKSDKPR